MHRNRLFLFRLSHNRRFCFALPKGCLHLGKLVLPLVLVLGGGCADEPEHPGYDSGPRCGDGVAEGREACDGNDLRGETCEGRGFKPGELSCSSSCELVTDSCGPLLTCGDGAIQSPEVCDGADLSDASCESLGFTGGVLRCASSCLELDTSECTTACIPDCDTRQCGIEERCGQSCGDCIDGTCNAQGLCELNDPLAPTILSFATNVETVYPGGAVVFSAIVWASEPSTMAGGLLEDTGGSAYGNFVNVGGGSYTITVDWNAIQALRPIETGPGGGTRIFVGRFLDSEGRAATTEKSLRLACPNDEQAVCGGTCTDATTTSNCGACNHACPSFAHAEPICESFVCSFQCRSGFHECSGECVANDSAETCGRRCIPCPSVSNGSGICVDESCEIECGTGYHLCDGACVSNHDTATCGVRCSPCPAQDNATTTCDGVACGSTCNSGYHDCGGRCVSNSDTESCGSRCSPCPADPHGTATCDGTSCGTFCNPEYHLCNDTCVSDANIMHCGESCSPCEPPMFSAATCDGTTCGYECNFGYRPCAGGCAFCPTNAAATTCSGSTCVASACPTGSHLCSGACVGDNDPAHCGTACSPCDRPPHATSTCNGTACGYACLDGFAMCGSDCVDLSFDEQNCGSCGHGCAPSETCSSGTCVGACANHSLTPDPPIAHAEAVYAIVSGRFGADASFDLATLDCRDGAETVFLYQNDGDGGFAVAGTFAVGFPCYQDFDAADVNGDGEDDLIVGEYSNYYVRFRFLLSTPSGYEMSPLFESVIGARRHRVLDIDGDGHQDIVALAGGTWADSSEIRWGTGLMEFADWSEFVQEVDDTAFVDLNEDGRLDRILSTRNVHLEMNSTGRVFGPSQLILQDGGFGARRFEMGDFNEDGQNDIFLIRSISSVNASEEGFALLIAQTDGSFASHDYRVGTYSEAGTSADFNNDGHLDVLAGDSYGGSLYLFTGDGTGTMTKSANLAPGTRVYAITPSDFDGDGDLDAVVLTTGSQLTLWRSNCTSDDEHVLSCE